MNTTFPKKSSLRKISAAIIVALLLITGILWGKLATGGTGIKSDTTDILGTSNLPKQLQLEKHELQHTFTSATLKAEFSFNAIAPLWKVTQDDQSKQKVVLRVSNDGHTWTEWLPVQAGPSMRDDRTKTDQVFPETPIFIEGRYFQYQVTLAREHLDQKSPLISEVKMNYLDSRETPRQKLSAFLKNFFSRVGAGSNGPYIVSRGEWGSPDPHNHIFKGSDKYWPAEYAPTKQVFLHHTVSASVQSDPKAIVRGIWDYHANTLGWGDIGYNYLVDHKGTIYEGRHGGTNVIGGHTLSYNKGSMGVAVLGCFEPGDAACRQLNGGSVTGPTADTIERLADFLSFKTTLFHINPDISHNFCDSGGGNCRQIATIAAHRDAGDTECNGQYFYDKMNVVRQKTRERTSADIWGLQYKITRLQKASQGDTQQLFYITDTNAYSTAWGSSLSGLQRKKIMTSPVGQKIVDIYKLTEPDNTTQKVYIATDSGIYETRLVNGDYSAPTKIVSLAHTQRIIVDAREESGELTHRLYALTQDGPYEFWWRNDTEVSAGSRLWNITNGLDFVKSKDSDGLDELYVATKSEVYRMKWPINNDVQRKLVTSLPNIVAIDKQNLIDNTELLYTATTSGVHETWWKPDTNFSNPAKIIHISGLPVVDIKKTMRGNYHQLYVADQGQVQEFWWGTGVSGIQRSKLIHISANNIVAIDKDARGAYQNLYTAHNAFINETWWGNGQLGNGPAIVDAKSF